MGKFNKVAIIGVGEIGGSIGRRLLKRKLAGEVVGIGRHKSSLKKALSAKTVHKTTLSLENGVKDADLIVISTPVNSIIELAKEAARHAKAGAIITDAGSTKKIIVEKLEKVLPGKVRFVGSHPMAGSEKGGPLAADGDLFVNRVCFITETKHTDRKALGMVRMFWEKMGSKTIVISPDKHDKVVAKISQMVHIVASALVIANKDTLRYAASGFRDTTRIALSNPDLWDDICMTNNKNIGVSLSGLIEVLEKFRKAILTKDASAIKRMLKEAQALRKTLNQNAR